MPPESMESTRIRGRQADQVFVDDPQGDSDYMAKRAADVMLRSPTTTVHGRTILSMVNGRVVKEVRIVRSDDNETE